MDLNIDIIEQRVLDLDPELLDILLRDETTGLNIRWATDDYADFGKGYAAEDQIFPELITGKNTDIIRPRILKETSTQADRTREKAEVFTPAWVCNRQNNLIDEAWFGRANVFNCESENGWITCAEKIEFPVGRTWQEYVLANRLEITCGEAPYLTCRYDAVSGTAIPVKERVGLLDRKLRVICEYVQDSDEWFDWAVKALQSIYGYDFQGDNVLLARENVLAAVAESYYSVFHDRLDKEKLRQAAIVISWNIWQMNGLTYTAPFSEEVVVNDQTDLFSEMGGQVELTQEIACHIMDWQAGETVLYKKLIKGR